MKYIYYSVAFIVIGAIIAVSVWYATRPVPLTIQGEFHSKQVQVAAKVPGFKSKRNSGCCGSKSC